jgi:hypothetical protein
MVATERPLRSPATGYDFATGLGSVDAMSLFDAWPRRD